MTTTQLVMSILVCITTVIGVAGLVVGIAVEIERDVP